MPCTCDDFPEQEKERAACIHLLRLLVYVYSQQGKSLSGSEKDIMITRGAKELTHELCWHLTSLSDAERDRLLYTADAARSRDGRDLATWWEDHQEADLKRMIDEYSGLLRSVARAERELAEAKFRLAAFDEEYARHPKLVDAKRAATAKD